MEDQHVRNAIHALIARNEVRIGQLRHENKIELLARKRMENELTIMHMEFSIATLIELEHNLHLCDCPDEAYAGK